MELIRQILLGIEKDGQGLGIVDLEFADHDDEPPPMPAVLG